jgi:hypothetical protein
VLKKCKMFLESIGISIKRAQLVTKDYSVMQKLHQSCKKTGVVQLEVSHRKLSEAFLREKSIMKRARYQRLWIILKNRKSVYVIPLEHFPSLEKLAFKIRT